MLSVRDLSLSRGGAKVLRDVSFDLGAGGCTVILGPNGAGKSLLLKVLHGLIAPDTGHVSWAGQDPAQARTRQAMVFQTPVLLRRSVAANIDFVLRARGRDMSERAALLDRVGLIHKARQPARRLSGGEAQRLAIARALATGPDVLLMDEPAASLDPAATQAVEALVRDTCARGIRVLLVTHDIGQARRLATDVLFLCAGRLAEQASAQRFFPLPQTQAARDFIAGRLVV